MREPWTWRDVPRAAIALLVLIAGVPILLLAAPFLAIWALRNRVDRRRLAAQVPGRWQGRRLLFVYSNSPVWKEYLEANWLPRLAEVAVVLNWSERKRWSSEHPFEERVFQRFAGRREFNPAAIAFLPDGRVEVVRFWRAFRDFKHGKAGPLRAAESRLEEIVAVIRAGVEAHV